MNANHRHFTDLATEMLDSARRILNHGDLNDFHLRRANAAIQMASVYADLPDTAARAEANAHRDEAGQPLEDLGPQRGEPLPDTDGN